MKPGRPACRQSGALLLTVALLLAIMAALAFGLNRAAGMDTQSVTSTYERRNAAYLAEGAVAAAKWINEVNKHCGSLNLAPLSFANATLSATVTPAPSKRINVAATASTATGATGSLTRTAVDVIDFTKVQSKNLGGAVQDTYVDPSLPPMNLATSLVITSAQSNALILWAMTDIPKDSEVLSAQLILTQNGAGDIRTVNVHRITTQWDGTATWSRARGGVAWNGGDYSAPAVSSAVVGSASTASWDVTGLVDGWASGRLANYGMLLRLPDPGRSVTFYSMAAATSVRPVLSVKFAPQC